LGLPYTISGKLISAERDGVTNISRLSFSGYNPLAPSSAYDGHPTAEATGWVLDLDASLAWLREHRG
jgi:hypothetical protein